MEAKASILEIFRELEKTKLKYGSNHAVILAASHLIHLRMRGLMVKTAELAALHGVPEKKMLHCFHRAVRELGIVFPLNKEADYVAFVWSYTPTPKEILSEALALLSKEEVRRVFVGRDKMATAAALLYHVCQGKRFPITQTFLAGTCGVTEQTIRLRLRELEGALRERGAAEK